MNRPKFYIYLPIVFALLLMAGIYIGSTFRTNQPGVVTMDATNPYSKVEGLMHYIQEQYVDSVDMNALSDKIIAQTLQNLDPHSSYISAAELQDALDPLEGKFSGVGIQFSIIDDTLCVIAVIGGGPAEKMGVLAGDKIIKAAGKNLAGVGATNRDVTTTLKGEAGSKVKITVKRTGQKKLIPFTITRGEIPIHSIDLSKMLNDSIGYIKLARFARTSHDEFVDALKKLNKKGMKALVLDLRGNGGGLLTAANKLCDELLEEGMQIAYTEGKSSPREDYVATKKGRFKTQPLVILIDGNSASASEIMAGAVQDNDRGTIIGRRSFGKGLVQEQSQFEDGSALRLTKARYYTPTGRCIQRTYENGAEDYYNEAYNRSVTGELETADSIKVVDSLVFTTPKGKKVYGGGGIVPDVFVPVDTGSVSLFLSQVVAMGYLNEFAFSYTNRHRKTLKAFKNADLFNEQFTLSEALLQEFYTYCSSKGIEREKVHTAGNDDLLAHHLKALIARNMWNAYGYYTVMQSKDKMLKAALLQLQ